MRLAAILLGFPLTLIACQPDLLHRDDDRETPVTKETGGRAGRDMDPEPSPDGLHLFYTSTSFSGDADLYVKKIRSNTTTRITSLSGNERFPKVNPVNPRMLAFCSDTGGTWRIHVMKDYREGPEQIRVVSERGIHAIHPSWSPDGRKIVYSACDELESGEWTLRILDLAAGRTQILEGIDGLLPEWSPEGNRILFQRMKHRDNWIGSIWTLEYADGMVKNLTSVFRHDDWAAINPSWSPDGRSIVFATVAKSPGRRNVMNEADDLWTVHADGTRPMRLTTDPAADWMPKWSPDGRIYFVSNRSGTDRIWSLAPDPTADAAKPGLPRLRPIVSESGSGR